MKCCTGSCENFDCLHGQHLDPSKNLTSGKTIREHHSVLLPLRGLTRDSCRPWHGGHGCSFSTTTSSAFSFASSYSLFAISSLSSLFLQLPSAPPRPHGRGRRQWRCRESSRCRGSAAREQARHWSTGSPRAPTTSCDALDLAGLPLHSLAQSGAASTDRAIADAQLSCRHQ